ncbi:DUF3175 domain-containing protein [Nitrosomonas sp.]|uniref:DUF3175 domain-containing protein n=1 Tax=Nitrosomonas sp. TaxID=42353 RepID=UPI00261C2180|nr:DUF3175 domain-containing protein [Nitrosomonas sp.]
MPQNNPRHWSQQVTGTSNALDLEPGVFSWDDPRKIALSLKHSADNSQRRKAAPFAAAMSMLNFYINRAGKHLSAQQRDVLERAKNELRELYGKSHIKS